MDNKIRIIKGLECCLTENVSNCDACPYKKYIKCMKMLMNATLTYLKNEPDDEYDYRRTKLLAEKVGIDKVRVYLDTMERIQH